MWIVRLALRRTYTFVVVALLIAVLGAVSIYRMSTDIFPEIDIPVISIVWSYNGLSAQEMGQRIASQNERSLTTTVSDIEPIPVREQMMVCQAPSARFVAPVSLTVPMVPRSSQ